MDLKHTVVSGIVFTLFSEVQIIFENMMPLNCLSPWSVYPPVSCKIAKLVAMHYVSSDEASSAKGLLSQTEWADIFFKKFF